MTTAPMTDRRGETLLLVVQIALSVLGGLIAFVGVLMLWGSSVFTVTWEPLPYAGAVAFALGGALWVSMGCLALNKIR